VEYDCKGPGEIVLTQFHPDGIELQHHSAGDFGDAHEIVKFNGGGGEHSEEAHRKKVNSEEARRFTRLWGLGSLRLRGRD
jgi:hypothetical protein